VGGEFDSSISSYSHKTYRRRGDLARAFWKAFLTRPSIISEFCRRDSLGEELLDTAWAIGFFESMSPFLVMPNSNCIFSTFSSPDSDHLFNVGYKYLPSPIFPVFAARSMVSITGGTISSVVISSILTLGRKSILYSAPRKLQCDLFVSQIL